MGQPCSWPVDTLRSRHDFSRAMTFLSVASNCHTLIYVCRAHTGGHAFESIVSPAPSRHLRRPPLANAPTITALPSPPARRVNWCTTSASRNSFATTSEYHAHSTSAHKSSGAPSTCLWCGIHMSVQASRHANVIGFSLRVDVHPPSGGNYAVASKVFVPVIRCVRFVNSTSAAPFSSPFHCINERIDRTTCVHGYKVLGKYHGVSCRMRT